MFPMESVHHRRLVSLAAAVVIAAAGALAVWPVSGDAQRDGAREAEPARNAFHVSAGKGRALWLNGQSMNFKATANRTNGSFTLVEASVPPGAGPPLHVHPENDEAFYLVSGSLRFRAGDRVFRAKAGDFVFVPRGTRHNFKNLGHPTAKLLFMYAPGGAESVLFDLGRPARPGVPVPPPARRQARGARTASGGGGR